MRDNLSDEMCEYSKMEDEMKTIPYFDRMLKTLAPLNLRPVTTHRGEDISDLQRIELEMMTYEMKCFEVDHLDKIVIIKADIMGGKLVIHAMNIFPNDECPLPLFTSEIIQAVNHVGLRVDLIPLADCALDMDYFHKYLMPLEDIWKKCKDKDGAVFERHHWARALSSPFYGYGKYKYNDTIEDESLDITDEYLKIYVKHWQELEKADPTYMAPLNERKKAIIDIYKEWDPGRGPLKSTVGDELADRIMNVLF
jgi:hypothetical protein